MALAVSAQTSATPAEVVVSDIAVLDVASGQWLAGRDIVVRGTRIERIDAGGGALPPAKTTIAGRGKFAIPALIGGPVRAGGLSAGDAQRVCCRRASRPCSTPAPMLPGSHAGART